MMTFPYRLTAPTLASVLALSLGLAACVPPPQPTADLPQSEFWDRLSALCGQAFRGTVVSTDSQDEDWRAAGVLMHVATCDSEEIRIPLKVGDDTSRTWILSRGTGALTLAHQHLHSDGSPDAVSMYGGQASADGSGSRQNFPADAFSKALFEAEGIPASASNVWSIEIRPDANLFVYELTRPERFFRAEFDLSAPVAPDAPAQIPPAPSAEDALSEN
jgi:hypothetical protein